MHGAPEPTLGAGGERQVRKIYGSIASKCENVNRVGSCGRIDNREKPHRIDTAPGDREVRRQELTWRETLIADANSGAR
jgi:hypothetical protein